jgi:uncharacterized membrane protein YedE/YeeE
MNALAALLAGALFGAGLLVSGMSNPQVVLGFLDVAGHWNPALVFTMAGAIAVAAPAFWWRRRQGRAAGNVPGRTHGAAADEGTAPQRRPIDARLLGGSALFGVGWGLAGICPGPGLVLLTGFALPAWAFVAAMAVGMLLFAWLRKGAGAAPQP